jgi:hypothetical protein
MKVVWMSNRKKIDLFHQKKTKFEIENNDSSLD